MKRSRRSFLRAAALAGTVGAAGCGGNGTNTRVTAAPDDGGGTPTDAANATGTATNATDTGATVTETETATTTPESIGESETWRQFQADAANTGAVPLNHSGFLSGQRNWSVTLDAGPTRQPAFDETRLYVPTGSSLHAVDRESQSVVWTFEAATGPVTTPLVPGDGFVYVVTNSGVTQINAEAGWTAFEFNFVSEFPDVRSVEAPSAPVLAEESIVFNLILQPSSGSRRRVNRTVSLSLRGKEEWVRDEPSTDGREATLPANGFAPTPAFADGKLFFTAGWAAQEASLYAVGTGGGGKRIADYTGKGWSSITVADGLLYFADRFADVFKPDGSKVTRRRLEPPPNAYACAAGSEFVFMSSRTFGGNEGRLFAIDKTGRLQWTLEGEGNLYVPTATEETVYLASASGKLLAIDQADGLVRWSQDLGLSTPVVASAPVVSTDEIYLTAASGSGAARLVAVSPTS